MDWLEQELREALERKQPPPGFAARVISRTAMKAHRPVFVLPRWLPVAAAVLVIVSSGGLAWRRHQGMVAKDQVMLAMRITAGKLSHIQNHMREVRQ
jgi:hypothetical protein